MAQLDKEQLDQLLEAVEARQRQAVEDAIASVRDGINTQVEEAMAATMTPVTEGMDAIKAALGIGGDNPVDLSKLGTTVSEMGKHIEALENGTVLRTSLTDDDDDPNADDETRERRAARKAMQGSPFLKALRGEKVTLVGKH